VIAQRLEHDLDVVFGEHRSDYKRELESSNQHAREENGEFLFSFPANSRSGEKYG
jgi:hypothetical protein